MGVAVTILGYMGIVVFILVLVVGVLATLVGLPGTVLILMDAFVYSAVHSFARPPWWLLLILLGICVVAETSDNIVSALGVTKSGGSTKTSIWAVVGGVAGAIIGANISPLLGLVGLAAGPIGTVIGVLLAPLICALAGGYLAGYWYERRQGRPPQEARQAGWGALLGRLAGGLLKAILASVMVALILWTAF